MAEIISALEERQEAKEYPILWWTEWFHERVEEGKVVNYCGLPYTCKFTLDKAKYDETKVVIIHASSFEPSDVPNLHDVKSGKKALVLNTLESPKPFQVKSEWTSIFTHLWSYSFNADFVATYFVAGRGPGTFLDYILSKPVYTIQQKNAFRKDLAPVAWIVSSCTSHNGRHFFIKQLLKYTNIDIYGRCMKNKDWPMHPDGRSFSDREVVARYKFYLSIENSNCDDYVTEKIERPYAVGVVPILDGPKDYSRFLATNHSSLRLDDFATPEQLALRIHQLDQDDNAYLKYLDYKDPANPVDSLLNPRLLETFDVPQGIWGPDDLGARCGLCKLAHDMTEGTYQLTPNKVIGPDPTCYFTKWGYISWVAEFYWWIIVLVVLGIFAVITVIIASSKSRRARRSLQALKYSLTPARWREKRVADDHSRMEDYQLLASQSEH
ncbi:Alpha-(1,3)-fucosyltransferase 11 [Mortierella hygrophila]|uniref:Fucosyltransferase n=1 Tax=Mortierella hygrophila TaxID=979708 RepID=A0A9P6K5U8_9FUNG|nr:Alpha-(1,3)-fucosyltransferase 11 [Mortierella hygrophila]